MHKTQCTKVQVAIWFVYRQCLNRDDDITEKNVGQPTTSTKKNDKSILHIQHHSIKSNKTKFGRKNIKNSNFICLFNLS